MYGVEKTDGLDDANKEASANRVTRDECDVNKLRACFTSGAMTDPFANDTGELVNFPTGVVLSSSIPEKLLARTDKGREQIKTFMEKRLNTDETSF